MGQRLHVHVVDADYARRAAIARELYARSIHVEIYEDLEELIARAPSQGTVLAYADQPLFDEIEFIETLREGVGYLPVAFYSAAPTPGKIVNAMLSGAIDYMQWPFCDAALDDTLLRLALLGEQRSRIERRRAEARRLVAALTPRERDALVGVVEGSTSKEIAERLAISPRTVDIHRGNMLMRLKAGSTAEAVRIGLDADLAA